jgi:hypothetical protein
MLQKTLIKRVRPETVEHTTLAKDTRRFKSLHDMGEEAK